MALTQAQIKGRIKKIAKDNKADAAEISFENALESVRALYERIRQ
jgi:hypothetical protein